MDSEADTRFAAASVHALSPHAAPAGKSQPSAAEGAENLGGMKGLLHLLRDPEVQRGLRTLAVMPHYLENTDRH
jgi:uncharacterized protein YjgD (DUF1641 family)